MIDFIGNQSAIAQLLSMTNNPPASIIITGPRNIGKSCAARLFIQQSVSCKDALCASRWMHCTKESTLDEIIALLNNPYKNTSKHFFNVLKIEDKLSSALLSGILKSIEEPLPGRHTIIISDYDLPSTIISRSVVVHFDLPSIPESLCLVKLRFPDCPDSVVEDALYWTANNLSLLTAVNPSDVMNNISLLLKTLLESEPSLAELFVLAEECCKNPELSGAVITEWLSMIACALISGKAIPIDSQPFVEAWGKNGIIELLGMFINFQDMLHRQQYINGRLLLETSAMKLLSRRLS